MGFMDKVKFWKKDSNDVFGFDDANFNNNNFQDKNSQNNNPFGNDSFSDDSFMKDPLSQQNQDMEGYSQYNQSNQMQENYPSMHNPQFQEPDSESMRPIDPFSLDPVKNNRQFQQNNGFSENPNFQHASNFQHATNIQKTMPARQDPYSDNGDHTVSRSIKGHELELIITKLDTLKAMMEGISQRLENLERSGRDEYSKGRW
jgi:hypothetical protein